MIIMGIDNGVHGAIAWAEIDAVTHYRQGNFVADMPTETIIKNKKECLTYNVQRVADSIRAINPDMVYIENAQAMPLQGVVSMFSTGLGFGIVRGIVSALQIPHKIVSVREWQNFFGLFGAGKNTKRFAYNKARIYFPKVELSTKRGRIFDGRCDALLIMRYAIHELGLEEKK